MPDRLTPEQRSRNMAAIRSNGNLTTEVRLAKLLRLEGVTGWRRRSKLFGSPDFVFCEVRLAVFVDGDFWHGRGKPHRVPKSNSAYWSAKIERNKTRDKKVNQLLRKKGWRVLRIWENDLAKHPKRVSQKIRMIVETERQKELSYNSRDQLTNR